MLCQQSEEDEDKAIYATDYTPAKFSQIPGGCKNAETLETTAKTVLLQPWHL